MSSQAKLRWQVFGSFLEIGHFSGELDLGGGAAVQNFLRVLSLLNASALTSYE